MKNIVLYSGGPDSLVTLRWVEQKYSEIVPVYYRLGHRYEDKEILSIHKTIPHCLIEGVLEGLGSWEEEDAHIFHRNAFLVLAASKLLDKGSPGKVAGTIWLSVQKDERTLPDRSLGFFKEIESLLWTLGHWVWVMTPWEDLDKTQMVEWYMSSGGDVEALKNTWSCYQNRYGKNEQMHCGNCPACIRRFVAFSLNGISEPYWMDPRKSDMGLEYVKRAKLGYYSPQRAENILKAYHEEVDTAFLQEKRNEIRKLGSDFGSHTDRREN